MIRNLDINTLVAQAEVAYVAAVQAIHDANPIPSSFGDIRYPTAALPPMHKEAFRAFATELNAQLRALGVLVDD
jgi:hypothetical protein